MTKSYEDAIHDVLDILERWSYIAIVRDAVLTIEDQVKRLLITAHEDENQDN